MTAILDLLFKKRHDGTHRTEDIAKTHGHEPSLALRGFDL